MFNKSLLFNKKFKRPFKNNHRKFNQFQQTYKSANQGLETQSRSHKNQYNNLNNNNSNMTLIKYLINQRNLYVKSLNMKIVNWIKWKKK